MDDCSGGVAGGALCGGLAWGRWPLGWQRKINETTSKDMPTPAAWLGLALLGGGGSLARWFRFCGK